MKKILLVALIVFMASYVYAERDLRYWFTKDPANELYLHNGRYLMEHMHVGDAERRVGRAFIAGVIEGIYVIAPNLLAEYYDSSNLIAREKLIHAVVMLIIIDRAEGNISEGTLS